MAREIVEKRELFEQHNQESVNTGTDRANSQSLVTLQDVFKKVKKDNYPFLWTVHIKIQSFIPTSASCEQCFSCPKHRLHENMKKSTAFKMLLSSQKNTVTSLCYGFENELRRVVGTPRLIKRDLIEQTR